MPDFNNTVDRIRAFMAGADRTRTDGIAELAAAYTDACQEANNRLRRCVDYLRRGLRSEAIHSAEIHPPLLDLVSALDIPEVGEWEQVCAMYGLTRPMRIMIESAQELNEAYAQAEPLKNLLSEHRLLALAHSPIYQRLEVIRELAQADAGNGFWAEDQEEFERARLNELRTHATTAIQARDIAGVDRLNSEINGQKWRMPVPAEIVELVSNASWTLHAENAVAQLRQLVPDIRAALRSASYEQGKALQLKWKKIKTDAKLQPPQDLEDEIIPLKQWISEYEQSRKLQFSFEESCARLRSMMDLKVPLETLNGHYRELNGFGLPIPTDLQRSFADLVRRQEKNERFERMGIYALLMVIGVVVLGGAVAVVWNYFVTGKH